MSDPSRTTAIANKIRTMSGVRMVRDGRDALGRLMAIARVVRGVSVAGVIVLLITAIFIISNAIKLTLYARRREIRIMKLVGATNWFVRVPLIIEGVVFGAAGAFAAWLLLRLGGGLCGPLGREHAVYVAVLERHAAGGACPGADCTRGHHRRGRKLCFDKTVPARLGGFAL